MSMIETHPHLRRIPGPCTGPDSGRKFALAALLVERHPLAIACPKILRCRAVEFAVLAPIVFGLGFAIAAGI